MNVFDLSAKIAMDINGYLKGMNTAKAVAISTMSIIGSAVSDFMSDSINVGKGFDKSMSQVAATMGLTMGEMANQTGTVNTSFGEFSGTLRDFAQYMGRNTAFTATQAADALNYMALAGYSTQKSMETLPQVLNLAAAGNMDLARASDVVTDVETAFGNTSQRTAKMINEMAKTASISNTSVEQLGDAFLVVGGLAQELNGGFIELGDGTKAQVDGVQELEIALGAMANAGIKGSAAGTHMRNMLMKLSKPTAEGTKQLEALGVQVYDSEGKMRSLSDIFGDLNTSMETLTQEEKVTAIARLFNARDLTSATALLNAVGQDWDIIGAKILDAGDAADQMSKTQLDNLAGDMTLFGSALEGAQIAISDAATPALRNMYQVGTAAIQGLTEGFQKLPPEIQGVIGMLGLIGGKALEILPQVASLVTQIAMLKAAREAAGDTRSLASSLKDLGKKGGIATGVIAAVAVGVQYMRGEIDKAVESSKNLHESTTELSDGYTDVHGQVEGLNETLVKAGSTEEKIAIVQQLIADAQKASATATTQNKDAVNELSKVQETEVSMSAQLIGAFGGVNANILAQAEALGHSANAYGQTNEVTEQTSSDLEYLNGVLENLQAQQIEENNVVTESNELFDVAGAKITDWSNAVQLGNTTVAQSTYDSFQQVVEATGSMADSLVEGISHISSWYDELEKKEHRSTETLLTNWEAQIQATKNWETDLDKLLEAGIDEGLIERFAKAGPAGDELMMALQDAMINDPGSLPDLVDQVNDLFGKQLDMEGAMNDEAEGIIETVGALTAGSEEEFQKLVDVANAAGLDAGENLTKGFVQGGRSLIAEVEDMAEDIGDTSLDSLYSALDEGSPSRETRKYGKWYDEGFINGMKDGESAITSYIKQMGSNALTTLQTSISNGFKTLNLTPALSGAFSRAVNFGNSYYNSFYNVGLNMMTGLGNGAAGRSSYVISVISNTMTTAISRAKRIAQIQSPSKVFKWMGQMMDKGLEIGVEQFADGPIGAVEDLAENVNSAMGDGLYSDYVFDSPSAYIPDDYATEEVSQRSPVNVTMNIYGAEGQDVHELANIVSQQLALQLEQEQAVWA